MSTIFKKSIIGSAVALGLLAGGQAMADVSSNVSIVSQYLYRGIAQSGGNPAIQGGFDYTNSNGFYAGTWGSSISWLSDQDTGSVASLPAPSNGTGMEWDLYGGYRGTASGLPYDVGVLEYYYPGRYRSGFTNPNTTEVYGSLSYKWLTAKLSYVVSSGLFGFDKADGSYYADLTANLPVNDTLTATVHVGSQHFAGSGNSDLSYEDWKLGITKDMGNGWSANAYYSGTNTKDSMWKLGGNIDGGNNLGKGVVVVGLSRSM